MGGRAADAVLELGLGGGRVLVPAVLDERDAQRLAAASLIRVGARAGPRHRGLQGKDLVHGKSFGGGLAGKARGRP
ncbi:hypothetical protein SCMU_38150 [Sinomonas cyclohexanicum]|uniref:Uncharacterized protein n=1 Tax=Sinomonas cyclohexanicum TaxID=322009 RepID=A0ABM7Q0H6_SINCY|nr:hypothetical protein SCMU_38150 [Corynebacterium cyclohexanicum]